MAKESIAEKVFDVLFTKWWAALILGAVLIASGAFVFWGIMQNPGQGAELKRSGKQVLAAGVLAVCGLCLVAVGLFNLFGSAKTQSPDDDPA
jgi:hypothetical protein